MKTGFVTFPRFIGAIVLVVLLINGFSMIYAADWKDFTAPIDARVANLMTLLSTQEKISLRNKTSPAITRLNIAAVQWWTEMGDGWTTIFPASIAKCCTWDPYLMFAIGKVYGDEARSAYKKGQQFYSPAVVNLALDPRDGRNDETWGEDPYLGSTLASQLIRGGQGNREYRMPSGDEYYLKVSFMAKHFIGNNHENSRYNDVSTMDERDFYEWFLPPFKALIDADVGGVMCGLNPITITGNAKVQSIPNILCAFTLDTILRKQWGWKGYTTSDCGGVSNAQQVPALAAGLDAECEDGLEGSFDANTVDKVALNQAVSRLFRLRFRMGEFDPASACPYLNPTVNMTANTAVALQAAHEVVVLAKNSGNLLPLNKSVIKSIALVGPMASRPTNGSDRSIFGGYSRAASDANTINVLQALTKVANANGMTLTYVPGMQCLNSTSFTFSATEVQQIKSADIVIGVVGTDNKNGTYANVPCQGDSLYPGEGKDLPNLRLPGVQEAMLSAAYNYNNKMVTVLQDEEVRTLPFVFDTCPAVVICLTGGQAVGQGISDVLFGDFNPSGKLAQTWMKSIADYPDRKDCTVRGKRTYWYFDKPVYFPFGHGLSYTTFAYSNINATMKSSSDTVASISFFILNSGPRDGAEVAQLYVHTLNPAPVRPLKELRNYKRIDIAKGATSTLTLGLTPRDFAYWSTASKAFVADAGKYEILIGSSSQDIRLRDTITLASTQIVATRPQRQKEEITAQQGEVAGSVMIRRVFVDSRTVRFSGNLNDMYDVYTCNGKRIVRRKGSEMNVYLSHVPNGIYFVVDKAKAINN